MSVFIFGAGRGHLGSKAATIARQHGAELVNYTDAECKCGRGCSPGKCSASKRHWFESQNCGHPIDAHREAKVMGILAAEKLTK